MGAAFGHPRGLGGEERHLKVWKLDPLRDGRFSPARCVILHRAEKAQR